MEVARTLDVTKPSVVRVLESLMRGGLVVKERYGKIYLTDRGAFTVHYYRKILDRILENFPELPFPVDRAQREAAASPWRLPCRTRTSGKNMPMYSSKPSVRQTETGRG